MNKSSKNAMRFFSVVGMIEGISFILLLAIAMPLKYAFDIPAAVTIVGEHTDFCLFSTSSP